METLKGGEDEEVWGSLIPTDRERNAGLGERRLKPRKGERKAEKVGGGPKLSTTRDRDDHGYLQERSLVSGSQISQPAALSASATDFARQVKNCDQSVLLLSTLTEMAAVKFNNSSRLIKERQRRFEKELALLIDRL
jgi:hypothetical protein